MDSIHFFNCIPWEIERTVLFSVSQCVCLWFCPLVHISRTSHREKGFTLTSSGSFSFAFPKFLLQTANDSLPPLYPFLILRWKMTGVKAATVSSNEISFEVRREGSLRREKEMGVSTGEKNLSKIQVHSTPRLTHSQLRPSISYPNLIWGSTVALLTVSRGEDTHTHSYTHVFSQISVSCGAESGFSRIHTLAGIFPSPHELGRRSSLPVFLLRFPLVILESRT